MGEDWGPLFPQQQFNWQSPNTNYLGASFSSGQQNNPPLLMDPNVNMISTNGLPEYPFAELLRSQVDDDSDYTEDEEVTSTGHSPNTMTTHDKRDWFDGSTEEVASSDGSNKKRKLFDGGYSDGPSLMDTARSVKPTRDFEYEDDAESRCDNGTNLMSEEMGSESVNKRMRKERIRETVSILQNLIPGGKGKDAVIVLEEAIQYLKSISQVKIDVGVDLNMTSISQLKRWKLAEEVKIAVLLLRSMFIVQRLIIRDANQQALDHENFSVVSRKRNGSAA
ncbi:hypothetical protein D5086_022432 [Populus alba]|uniref:Uncharacterized protein n=1 Tax=Populus alba TaxID=43335 RepID=A0ACC4BGH3_POPAL